MLCFLEFLPRQESFDSFLCLYLYLASPHRFWLSKYTSAAFLLTRVLICWKNLFMTCCHNDYPVLCSQSRYLWYDGGYVGNHLQYVLQFHYVSDGGRSWICFFFLWVRTYFFCEYSTQNFIDHVFFTLHLELLKMRPFSFANFLKLYNFLLCLSLFFLNTMTSSVIPMVPVQFSRIKFSFCWNTSWLMIKPKGVFVKENQPKGLCD